IEIKVLETAIAILIFLLIRFVVIRLINRTVTVSLLHKTRAKIIKKLFQTIFTSLLLFIILTIWGVDQSELMVYIVSVLTVIGIALFAQWSHLSNLTSAIIIFFSHHVRLDDTIIVMDKDYEIEGRVSDVGFFFIWLKTNQGEEIILPNNMFMQQMIKKRIPKHS
ncbi:MAG: mechanosensitive ion channel, partial [Candidatus Kapaibacterium sp.]